LQGTEAKPLAAPLSEGLGPERLDASAYPSLSLVFEFVRKDYESQFNRLDSLRTRAGALMGVAAGVIAAAIAFATAANAKPGWHAGTLWGVGFLVASCVAFGLLFPLFRMKVTPKPRQLAEKYLTSSEESTKLQVISATLEVIKLNEDTLGWVELAYTIGILLLCVGMVLVGINLITRL
jgi:MFS family permease